jgi:hypothetical protein
LLRTRRMAATSTASYLPGNPWSDLQSHSRRYSISFLHGLTLAVVECPFPPSDIGAAVEIVDVNGNAIAFHGCAQVLSPAGLNDRAWAVCVMNRRPHDIAFRASKVVAPHWRVVFGPRPGRWHGMVVRVEGLGGSARSADVVRWIDVPFGSTVPFQCIAVSWYRESQTDFSRAKALARVLKS